MGVSTITIMLRPTQAMEVETVTEQQRTNLSSCLDSARTTHDGTLSVEVAIGLLVFVALSFTQTRKALCLKCCRGLPGIAIPLNFVHTSSKRLVYVLVFGAISGEILLLILNPSSSNLTNGSVIQTSLVTILVLIFRSCSYFPLFACVNAPIPLMGYSIGTLYSCLMLSFQCYVFSQLLECTLQLSVDFVVIQTFFSLPIFICLFLVLLWYLYSTIREIVRLAKAKKPFSQSVWERKEASYYSNRVKALLKKPVIKEHGKAMTCLLKVVRYFYSYNSSIQFPLQFLVAVIIMLISLYMLTLSLTYATISATASLPSDLQQYERFVEQLSTFLERPSLNLRLDNASATIATLYGFILDGALASAVILPAGPLVACCFNAVLLLHMVFSVHNNLRRIALGDYSFLPTKYLSPSRLLLSSVSYAGYQIAYFIWGWILVCAVIWLSGYLGLGLYYVLVSYPKETIYILSSLLFPLLFSFVLFYFELLVMRLVFVGDTKHKFVVIKNSRLFHWVSYVFFFHNVILGLSSTLLRIFYSVLFGLLLLFRLDRVVLMKGFENFDYGHKAYNAFMRIEQTQNNAVVNVFVKLMVTTATTAKQVGGGPLCNDSMELEATAEDKAKVYRLYTPPDHPRQRPSSRQAVNRWLVAYTLLRNRGIQNLTAARLADQLQKQEEEIREKEKGDKEREELIAGGSSTHSNEQREEKGKQEDEQLPPVVNHSN